MSEYDARSKAATSKYRDNFDEIFKKKPAKPKKQERQQTRCNCVPVRGQHDIGCPEGTS